MAKILCSKCKRQKDQKYFYTLKKSQGGGKYQMCKECTTMHINAYKPDTYLWLLEEFDVPYLPPEWNATRDKDFQKKGPEKFDHGAVFGKYLTKMKLSQWMDYGYADSEKLMKEKFADAGLQEVPTDEEEKKAAYELADKLDEQLANGEINESEYMTFMPEFIKAERQLSTLTDAIPENKDKEIGVENFFNENNFAVKEEDLPDPAANLSQEDKIYLVMKWGTTYSPQELLAMQQNYHNMEQSFDIQDADSRNTLKLICKTDLKMNQAIDMGDFDGYQKLSRVSDQLRKSAKFTAAQNKKEKGEFVDSIGQLVRYCQREEGFIPRWVVDIPQDKVDFTLQDMNKYLYNLVTEDLGFGQQIETYVQKIAIQQAEDQRISQMDDIAIENGEELIKEDIFEEVLQDADVAKFYEDEEEQIQETKARMEDGDIEHNAYADYAERVEKLKEKEKKKNVYKKVKQNEDGSFSVIEKPKMSKTGGQRYVVG